MSKDGIILSRVPFPWELGAPASHEVYHNLSNEEREGLLSTLPQNWETDPNVMVQTLETFEMIWQMADDNGNEIQTKCSKIWYDSLDLFAEIEAVHAAVGIQTHGLGVEWLSIPTNSSFLTDRVFCLKGRALILDVKSIALGHSIGSEQLKQATDVSSQLLEDKIKKEFPHYQVSRLSEIVNLSGFEDLLLEGGNLVFDPFHNRLFLGSPLYQGNELIAKEKGKQFADLISMHFNTETHVLFFTNDRLADYRLNYQMLDAVRHMPEEIKKFVGAKIFSEMTQDDCDPTMPIHLDQCFTIAAHGKAYISNYIADESLQYLKELGYDVGVVNDPYSANVLNIAHLTSLISVTTKPNAELQRAFAANGRILYVLPSDLDILEGGAHCLINRVGFNHFNSGPEFVSAEAFSKLVAKKKPKFLADRQREAIRSFSALMHPEQYSAFYKFPMGSLKL